MPRARGFHRRVELLRKAGIGAPTPTEGATRNRSQQAELSCFLDGWTLKARMVFSRTTTLTVPELPQPKDSLLLQGCYPGLARNSGPPPDYLFLDLETLSLGGGGGNPAFLAGVGRYSALNLQVSQLFMADYPGEERFLKLIQQLLPEDAIWLSYNGRSFDQPLLRGRFLMNRMHLREGIPLDLLHPVRRVWQKHLEDCSLTTVEEHLLRRYRHNDIPGEEIPGRYLAFLDSRDPTPLEPVVEHHLNDIVSLAYLFNLLETVLACGGGGYPHDPFGVGKLLLRAEAPSAEGVLRRGALGGDIRCGIALEHWLRARGRQGEAMEVWQRVWNRHGDTYSAERVAIHLEHHRKIPGEALLLVDSVLSTKTSLSPEERARWHHRRDRLVRKVQRVQG